MRGLRLMFGESRVGEARDVLLDKLQKGKTGPRRGRARATGPIVLPQSLHRTKKKKKKNLQ